MFHLMYLYLQDCIPAWVVSLLLVFFLSWFTFSGALMVAAGTVWSLLFWAGALVWSFFKALKGSHPTDDGSGDLHAGSQQ
jgi:hypothetical protein